MKIFRSPARFPRSIVSVNRRKHDHGKVLRMSVEDVMKKDIHDVGA